MTWRFRGIDSNDRFEFIEDATGISTAIHVEIVDGFVVFRRVDTVARDVTTDTLRQVHLGPIRAEITRLLREHPALYDGDATLGEILRAAGGQVPEAMTLAEKHAHAAVESLRKSAPRRGPGTRSQHHYREIAIAYLGLIEAGSTRPVADLAEQLGLSRNTVADWVRKARALEWLSPAQPGRAGGKPGPRLIAYREDEEQAAREEQE